MNNPILSEYPYGQFPTRYTKSGQEEMKRKWQEGKANNNNVSIQNVGNTTEDSEPTHSANTIDIHKLLPLIKKMNSNSPLSQGDLMGMLMGMLGKEHSDLVDIFSVIANTKTVKESDIKSMNINTNLPPIDSYKKVE